jgi:hypothetical protein
MVGDEIRAIFLKFDIKTIMARIPLEVTDWDNEITKQHYRDLDEAEKEAIEHFKPYLNETIIRDLRLKRGPKDWVVVPVTGTIRQIHFGIHGLTVFLNFIHPFTGKKEKTIIHI